MQGLIERMPKITLTIRATATHEALEANTIDYEILTGYKEAVKTPVTRNTVGFTYLMPNIM